MVNCLVVKESKKKSVKNTAKCSLRFGTERQEEKNGQMSFGQHCTEKPVVGNFFLQIVFCSSAQLWLFHWKGNQQCQC